MGDTAGCGGWGFNPRVLGLPVQIPHLKGAGLPKGLADVGVGDRLLASADLCSQDDNSSSSWGSTRQSQRTDGFCSTFRLHRALPVTGKHPCEPPNQSLTHVLLA